jgi:isopenicillin-N N-acyltransferase-like protein
MSDREKKGMLKIVEVGGSHYEMGFQYGKSCPEITEMLDKTFQLFGGRDRTRSIAEKYISLYLPNTEKYAPEIAEEMRGMADGAKVNLQDILFLNITYEISVPSVMGGCTSFAASGEATVNGKIIAGQNLDHVEFWQDYMILLKMNPADSPKIMAVTAAGCLSLIGINSAGISVNINLLRNKESLEPAGGVPTHIILRKIFMSENLGQSIAAIASAEGRSAKNYLETNKQGDIIDVETTANDMEIQFPERGMLTHANYFKTDRFKSTDLAPLLVPDAYVRSYRLFQLMEQHYGNISVDIMKQLLQDHSNYPNSICRHPDQKALLPIAQIMKTLISIISCPEEQKAYIAYGNPCESEYVEYRL